MLIMRRLDFDYGHRVWGHEGKCRHLHGHRGVAEIVVSATDLDGIGRVVDFGEVKFLIGSWVDHHWDHNFLLHPEDPLAKLWETSLDTLYVNNRPELQLVGNLFQGKPPYVMRNGNPTAENMARELFEESVRLLSSSLKASSLRVVRVRIWETPNCYAQFMGRPDTE